MQRERESRPTPAKVETANISVTTKNKSILPPTTLQHPKAIAPAYAVLVMRRDGHWRWQLFCSLHSAQKAMDRAEERGIEARCQLVELVPVPSSPVVIVEGGAA